MEGPGTPGTNVPVGLREDVRRAWHDWHSTFITLVVRVWEVANKRVKTLICSSCLPRHMTSEELRLFVEPTITHVTRSPLPRYFDTLIADFYRDNCYVAPAEIRHRCWSGDSAGL